MKANFGYTSEPLTAIAYTQSLTPFNVELPVSAFQLEPENEIKSRLIFKMVFYDILFKYLPSHEAMLPTEVPAPTCIKFPATIIFVPLRKTFVIES